MAEKRLTKEEAQALYDDLQRAVGTMMARGKGAEAKGAAPKAAPAKPAPAKAAAAPKAPAHSASSVSIRRRGRGLSGDALALVVIGVFCCAKITLSAIEASGIASVPPAEAAVVAPQKKGPQWSKEEVKVLTALDARRVELEERATRLDQRESEATVRDRDLAVKLTELKELTERLKGEREKGEKQRNTQLDQLANVYGSMNPPEAAHLLEQLDIQIALSLVERLPEKRMGQILSLMSPQKALELTQLLSTRRP